MIVDARTVPAGTVVEAEICIIGAGAAGITLAREFAGAPFRVVLLESGGLEYEQETEDLYAGRSIGTLFPDPTVCRLRYFGGTTNHWGGWCLPLDPIDFEARNELHLPGWPFPRTALDPFYRRAQEVCQIGPYDYTPAGWGIKESEIPAPFGGPELKCWVLQQSPTHFGPVYLEELRRAPRVTVYLHANALALDAGDDRSELREVTVGTLSGVRFLVRARYYVLACGGIENARLLLLSGGEGGHALGNDHDLVGRHFMVHLLFSGGRIALSDPYTDFSFYTGRGGTIYPGFGGKYSFVSFVGLSEAAMRRRTLPGIKFMWLYRFAPVLGAVEALRRLTNGEPKNGSRWADLGKVLGQLYGVGDFLVRKALFHEGVPVEGLDFNCSLEQLPNPDSRILLDTERDALGLRKSLIDWRVDADDKRNALASLRLVGAELGRTGFGRLRSALVDDDTTWPDDFTGNEHHMGTTRMHPDPKFGVVDADCQVHGIANFYVAGSSVFPSGGTNNPTLTIVALALRLADRLKERLA